MNTKLLTIGCILLMTAAYAPAVLGHSERPVLANDLGSGYGGPAAGAGVSGRYVGAAGPAVAIEAYTNPQDTLATGSMLCDAEVTGGGAAADEPHIDGFVNLASTVTDVWDDGGIGGACHTITHGIAAYNTPGCQAGQQARGRTHASTPIWIGAACDWKTVAGGIEVCGADGTADAINYGRGNTGPGHPAAIFPANNGIANPPLVPAPCPDGPASIFVFDTVITNGGAPNVFPALTGEVWS